MGEQAASTSHRLPAGAGVLVLLLLLAGCSGRSAVPAPATVRGLTSTPLTTTPLTLTPLTSTTTRASTPLTSTTTRTSTVRPTSAGSPSMPAAFLGRWNTDRAQCGPESQGSEGSLTVEPRHLQFYEGGGPVLAVVREGGVVTVTLTLNSEGSTEQATFRFAVSADGQTLTDLSTDTVRHRCG